MRTGYDNAALGEVTVAGTEAGAGAQGGAGAKGGAGVECGAGAEGGDEDGAEEATAGTAPT